MSTTTGHDLRWKRRPPGSTWGDWGVDDELGRLNLVTAEKVLQGIAEVRVGKTFCLSLPVDYPGGTVVSPRRQPPVQVDHPGHGERRQQHQRRIARQIAGVAADQSAQTGRRRQQQQPHRHHQAGIERSLPPRPAGAAERLCYSIAKEFARPIGTARPPPANHSRMCRWTARIAPGVRRGRGRVCRMAFQETNHRDHRGHGGKRERDAERVLNPCDQALVFADTASHHICPYLLRGLCALCGSIFFSSRGSAANADVDSGLRQEDLNEIVIPLNSFTEMANASDWSIPRLFPSAFIRAIRG